MSLGVSETNVTKRSWGDIKYDTIEKYFKDYDGSKAARYSSSFVFKVYSVDNLPTQKTIDNDLERIITIYKNTLNNDMDTLLVEEPLKRNLIVEFSESLKKSNLQVETKLIERYLYSLLTKPFVILTGLSGSGKTKLAQSFAQWLCAEKGQYRIIPVGSDWTTREPLLGYPNGLDDTQYVMPESGALSLLIEANKPENSSKPFFLILDEMNLSHVERYFADFLSVMESKEEILLYEGKERNRSEERRVGKE